MLLAGVAKHPQKSSKSTHSTRTCATRGAAGLSSKERAEEAKRIHLRVRWCDAKEGFTDAVKQLGKTTTEGQLISDSITREKREGKAINLGELGVLGEGGAVPGFQLYKELWRVSLRGENHELREIEEREGGGDECHSGGDKHVGREVRKGLA